MVTTPKIEYTKGNGNIYKDLGFPDSEERLAKAKLAIRIEEIIANRKLKQSEAAEILGVNQAKISAILNGRLNNFPAEELAHFLNLFHQD
jgi:predicted XRE-type DNA-binding protein